LPAWIWWLLGLIAVLFGLKVVYLVSTALSLPATKGAMFVTTSRTRVRAFLEAVPLGPGQLLIDLGCGDGRVLRAARRRYGVRAIGVEINPLPYLLARVLAWGRPGIEVRRGSFWTEDLGPADVVTCYLFPDVMARLADKLAAELRPGARVVSFNFPLPGWRPERVLTPGPSRHGDPIYIYHWPGARRGKVDPV